MSFMATFRKLLTSIALCVGALWAQPSVSYANAVTVDFTNLGSFQTAAWQQGALIVTGSGILNFLQYNGIGVLGITDSAVDPGESVIFSFSSPVTYVKLFNGALGNPDGIKYRTAVIQAFGAGGDLIGTVRGVEPTPWVVVSELFGDEPIQSFAILATEDLYRFSALEFALSVPEPKTVSMLIGGLGFLSIAIRTARHGSRESEQR